MKRIYCSGPMTGHPNNNYEAFDRNTKFLRDSGWDVISPAEMDAELGVDPNQPFSEEQYLNVIKHDYAALLTCDAIAFMPGFEKSRGAKLESDFANVLKLDRYRVDADNSYFEKELVIGLTGYAQSGKDTIAKEFINEAGFERHGFADALKEMLYDLNPIATEKISDVRDASTRYSRVGTIVDANGWEEAKKQMEIRQLLQRLGTEAGRKALGEDVWVKTLFAQPHMARLVIPDVRYENEAAEIRRRGGIVIRVIRDGVGPVNNHASDQISFDTDITVFNNGTPKEAYIEIVEQLPNFGIIL
jgi:hypothetical protein